MPLRTIALVWGAATCYLLAYAALHSGPSGGATLPDVLAGIVLLLLWAAATPLILRSAERFPLTGRRRVAHAALHLALAAAFILAINLADQVVVRAAAGTPLVAGEIWRSGLNAFLRWFHLALVVYAAIVGAGHLLLALDARRAEALRAERLRADLAEARLRALQLQMQPHFLFNALNAIGSLVLTGRHAEAFDAVGRLGDLLRGVLAAEGRSEVPFREEVELTRAYLAIEQIRLGDRLAATWTIDPAAAGARLPPMLLQPLVENAVRHGAARRVEPGRIVVRTMRIGDRLRVEVADDGPGPDEAVHGAGIGLANARRRLEELYGDRARLALERAGGWTVATVELPFRPAAESVEAAA